MFSKVRQFLRDRSPDWLNTEVNKDLLPNLTANIKSSQPTTHNNLRENEQDYSAIALLQQKISPAPPHLCTPAPNTITSEISFPTPGTPHWRRIRQVFQALDTAPQFASYNQLIEYIRETTGVGCSRKLISKWKKQKISQNSQVTSHKFPDYTCGDRSWRSEAERETNIVSVSPAMTISAAIPSSACQEMGVNSFQLNRSVDNSSNDNSLNRLTLLPVKAWTYLTAAGITIALVGCELLPLQLSNNRLPENVAFASVTAPLPPLPATPETRKNRLEPRNIKIELTLSNPTDLKVKPGDIVTAGQVLSDRVSERNRLQAKKKQLQLSLQKLNLPLTPIPQPKPIPEIAELPPVSYAEEEAAIKLHKQKLTEAESAIALQKEKIEQLRSLFSTKAEEKRSGGAREKISSNSPLHPCTPAPLHENCSPVQGGVSKHKLILEHEQANLKNLETARQSAQIQLEVTRSKLTTAKEQRAYIEYQRQLEQTRRAIALQQQQQAIASQESERSRRRAEREYSQAQIETQIQTLDYQIHQLSTVTAPYEGTIKKVKWTGQSDHHLTAVVTLSVNSDRPTIANSRAKSVNSHQ